MGELEIISQNNDWLEGATIHFSAMTTLVAFYIAALYAFLRRAPFIVRLIAYTFFVGSFIVFVRLGIGFLENVYAIIAIGNEILGSTDLSLAFQAWRDPAWYDTIPIPLLWYALVTMTVVALGWLTFFYSWKQAGEE